MPQTDIDSADTTSLTDEMEDWSVAQEDTDGASEDSEISYINTDWTKQLGYYKNIPELKIAIDTKANWVMGAGLEADEGTMLQLSIIKGNGKDSFNSILKNQSKVKDIGGDSFAEIITKDDYLVNLKPLNPGTIKTVQNKQGRILRYEQISRGKPNKIFQPYEIFHLSRERIADEIHGISVSDSVENIIEARNEAMSDWKKVLHRNIQPKRIWYVDTDDVTEIAVFKAKVDEASRDFENIIVPKGSVETEIATVAPNETLSALPTIDKYNDYFFQSVGVPQIIIGNAKEFTDASGKIVYLAFEQSIKAEQLYIEEQVRGQLNLHIELTFPASLQQDAISGKEEAEEEPQEQAAQPNDVKTEMEGKK